MIGVTIVIFFISTAVFAPFITPYDPIKDNFLAEPFALPGWYTIFPQYRDFPPNELFRIQPVVDANNWAATSQAPIHVTGGDNRISVAFETVSSQTSISTLQLAHKIEYRWGPPLSFLIQFNGSVPRLDNTACKLDIAWRTPRADTYLVWTSGFFSTSTVDKLSVDLNSKGIPFSLKADMGLQWYSDAAEFVFAEKGTYELLLNFSFQAQGGGASRASAYIGPLRVLFPGRIFGVLGTDHVGADLFSQLVYGTRISLMIGVLASLIAVTIGLLVGITAGFFGGLVDEGSMRFVDVLLVLPALPLLFLFSGLFGRSIWNLIFLIGFLSWAGFARVVRAQVLQLKTATFIEAAKALGASGSRIILRHLVPNVVPLAYATVALSIPGAIITEAALSFLALGDPTTPSWGRMFYSANAFGAFRELAWWWIVPPGIAITLLSMSFVFIGHALDEIINPRVRARR
jgi:peptide/nickel transport system permease protein